MVSRGLDDGRDLEKVIDVLYNYMIDAPSKIKVDPDIAGREIGIRIS
jgi:hypothetical protein